MKIIFFAHYFYPHIGGVEKHIYELSRKLIQKGHQISVVTEKYLPNIRDNEKYNGIQITRISYPKIKYLGLFFIWLWVFKNRKLFKKADVIHCHDVFIWYFPFRLLYPFKKIYLTIHGGWEGNYPILFKNYLLKRLSAKFSTKVICVGSYIEKYFNIKADLITYGAVNIPNNQLKKTKDRYIYLGRLDKEVGLPQFLKIIKNRKINDVVFCGDGPLRQECERFGTVLGFVDPIEYLKISEYCFASGYLSALEALAFKSKLIIAWSNPLKKDYWKMTPFYRFVENQDTRDGFEWVKNQTWERMAQNYLKLWSRA